ncbi:response regulator transcription factor [Streptomyces sp. GS7]|uniref:response regulator transcription factor n=1 Tax=Streptomyces sp. GS7 TaxID=2692234 RepID=UPI0013178C55|nr:response regulator transcription factor [Streptomyces sp. GS7]QHC21373.1 response regulator [Streptomyces sp. GS7]
MRVLLAEDMQLLRGALANLLRQEPDIEVVAELERGDEIVPTALHTEPDLALIDIGLPGMDGLTAAAQLHERLPACRCLIVTSLSQPGNIRRALEAHVTGFLLKDTPPDQLIVAMRKVANGERVIDSELAAAALESAPNPLTPREAEVLRHAAEGARPQEIAKRLHLELSTVRNHLSRVVTKSGARNRVDAIRIALHAGWI